MPINIPNGLPAKQILESEKIFALEEDVARKAGYPPAENCYPQSDAQKNCDGNSVHA